MNSTTTVTNADGSIVTTTFVSGHIHGYAIYALALLALILIVSGLYLLFRKEKSVSSSPDM